MYLIYCTSHLFFHPILFVEQARISQHIWHAALSHFMNVGVPFYRLFAGKIYAPATSITHLRICHKFNMTDANITCIARIGQGTTHIRFDQVIRRSWEIQTHPQEIRCWEQDRSKDLSTFVLVVALNAMLSDHDDRHRRRRRHPKPTDRRDERENLNPSGAVVHTRRWRRWFVPAGYWSFEGIWSGKLPNCEGYQ